MDSRLKSLLLLVATLFVITVAAIEIVPKLAVDDVTNSQRLVAQTFQVQKELDDIAITLRSAELSERDYLLTDDPAYLRRFDAAVRQLPRDIDDVDRLTVHHAALKQELTEISAHVNQLINTLGAEIKSAPGKGILPSIELMRSLKVDVGQIITQTVTNEGERLEMRQDAVANRMRWFMTSLQIVVLTACATFGLMMFMLMRDIRRRQELETELQKSKDKAEAANESKSRFLAYMSHEIRTPLNAIVGFAELLRESNADEPDRTAYLTTIVRNGKILVTLINDILDLSKVEAGKLKVELTDVRPLGVAQDVASLLSQQAREHGTLLRIEAGGPLPETIGTDPVRLRQILMNLVGNAVKFTEKGEVSITIKLAGPQAAPAAKLAFFVKDTGCGLTPEQQGHLFVEFWEGSPGAGRRRGTGLGLVLAKRMAQLLGGDVELQESIPGRGSTFVATVATGLNKAAAPLVPQAALSRVMPSAPAPKLVKPERSRPKLSGLHILLADDSPDSQILLRHVLERAGVAVDVAGNGVEAVEKARRGGFDLVLMDIQMPVMDGIDATVRLRQEGYAKPILALTAHAMKEERDNYLNSGFSGHIAKPIERESLLAYIAHFAPGEEEIRS